MSDEINLVVSWINHETLDQLTIFFMATRDDMVTLAEHTTGPLKDEIIKALIETEK